MTTENNNPIEEPEERPEGFEKFRANVYCRVCGGIFNILETHNVINTTNMACFAACIQCFNVKPIFIMVAEDELKYLLQMITIHPN